MISMPKQEVRKAIITDAGYATRFLPVTKTLPKSMIPIMDKPVMQYVIEECMEAGITEIIIVATEEGKPIYEDYFHNTVQHIYETLEKQNKSERFNKVRKVFSLPNIVVITQGRDLPYGNGSPIIAAKPYIGDEPFLHLFSDDFILGKSACKELIAEYYSSNDDVKGVIAVKDIPDIDVTKYGIAKLKDGTTDELDYIIEKPTPEEAPTSMVSFGRYLYTPEIYKYISGDISKDLGKDNELWAVDIIARMAKDHKVIVKPITGTWLTTGDPINYLKTTIDYVLYSNEYNGAFREFLKERVKSIIAEDQKSVKAKP